MRKVLTKTFMFFSIALLCTGICAEKALAISDGVYTVQTVAKYSNPETGQIEDGGTKNADIGESMSRSMTHHTALLEIENGNYYITLRLHKANLFNGLNFYTEPSRGANSFSETESEITAKNTSNSKDVTADYRMKVQNPNTVIKMKMYVPDMGRDVTFFAYLKLSTVANGKADFKSMIKAGQNAGTAKVSQGSQESDADAVIAKAQDKGQQENKEQQMQEQKTPESDADRPKNEMVSANELLDEASGIEEFNVDKDEEKSKSSDGKVMTLAGVGIIGVIALGMYGIYMKKMRS